MPITTSESTIKVPEKGLSPYVWISSPYVPADSRADIWVPGHYLRDVNKPNYYVLVQGMIYLATSAAVANRNIAITLTGIRNVGFSGRQLGILGQDIPANSQSWMQLLPQALHTKSPYGVLDEWIGIGKEAITMFGDDQLGVSIVNPQAGDNYQAYFLLKYLNWEWDNR